MTELNGAWAYLANEGGIMQCYQLKIYPIFYNVCISGDMQQDDDMFWNAETIGVSAASVMIPTPPAAEEELFSVKVFVAQDFPVIGDVFFEHSIRTGTEGIRVGEVEEFDFLEIHYDGDGNKVLIDLPWPDNESLLRFRAPNGFCKNAEGVAMPHSLEVLISPAF